MFLLGDADTFRRRDAVRQELPAILAEPIAVDRAASA
jgi:hypothetical protein